MRRFVTALAALVLLVTLYAGFRPLGPVPPLGRLLNPADGVWSAAATASHPGEASGRIPALGAGVRVLYDDRGVPHIFASSTLDAVVHTSVLNRKPAVVVKRVLAAVPAACQPTATWQTHPSPPGRAAQLLQQWQGGGQR